MGQTIDVRFDCPVCENEITAQIPKDEVVRLATEDSDGSIPILADDADDEVAELLPEIPLPIAYQILMTVLTVISGVAGGLQLSEHIKDKHESKADDARCPECGEPIEEEELEVEEE